MACKVSKQSYEEKLIFHSSHDISIATKRKKHARRSTQRYNVTRYAYIYRWHIVAQLLCKKLYLPPSFLFFSLRPVLRKIVDREALVSLVVDVIVLYMRIAWTRSRERIAWFIELSKMQRSSLLVANSDRGFRRWRISRCTFPDFRFFHCFVGKFFFFFHSPIRKLADSFERQK